jgi:hypothetical protein
MLAVQSRSLSADRAAPTDPLHMADTGLSRSPDQRAVFGRFCLNAAAAPLPPEIRHAATDGYQIRYFRRSILGIRNPAINTLAEPLSASEPDIWSAAEAAIAALRADGAADIVKLFVAGSSGAGQIKTGIAGDYRGVFLPYEIREALELTDSYERFLSRLGNHTRRDMRRLRRDADKAGYAFTVSAAAGLSGERRHLAAVGHPKPYSARQIDALDRFIAAQTGGFHADLRSASGALLSCCAGFISGPTAYVLYQLNHGSYRDASLSLTNRSFTIPHLIGIGARELVLPGGGGGLLAHFCRIRRGGELVLIRRSALASVKALAMTALRPASPVGRAVRRLAADS